MENKDKFYIAFIGKRLSVYITRPKYQVQVINYKGNVYKSHRTHREAVSAWVMYEPWCKKPNEPIESFEPIEDSQVISQLADDQVLKKTEDRKQNFLAPFVIGCVVTFTIMFFVQKFF